MAVTCRSVEGVAYQQFGNESLCDVRAAIHCCIVLDLVSGCAILGASVDDDDDRVWWRTSFWCKGRLTLQSLGNMIFWVLRLTSLELGSRRWGLNLLSRG